MKELIEFIKQKNGISRCKKRKENIGLQDPINILAQILFLKLFKREALHLGIHL